MTLPYRFVLLALLAVLAAASGPGCAARLGTSMTRAVAPVGPRPLDRSLFAREPHGQLGEDALQRILSAPVETDFPGRVGVVPVLTARDWRGPAPDYERVPAGAHAFAKALRGSPHFPLVSEVMPIPSGALGMQALREVAARYKLRYLFLYREVLRRDVRANAWAAAYATVVGALFVPGHTLEVSGYLEGSLFDVKTGLLLFTVRREVRAHRGSNLWYWAHKHDEMQAELGTQFAPELAGDARAALERFAEAARLENDRRAPRAASTSSVPPRPPADGA